MYGLSEHMTKVILAISQGEGQGLVMLLSGHVATAATLLRLNGTKDEYLACGGIVSLACGRSSG